ncbi:hypothetical protein EGT29_21210 [Pigmentiphaga sp. H8]|uniref:hypothetical protein n=1 Tax=Pigmentiphaga sp. H8 TaxID=2488560 RepID=UPI000F5A3FCD|nr:hypothetical protein [Pigmentiphaga sp. H8]AZG10182.1 hypothetical protein EGT29_21210 [Pigmentiphaga sp. H8]
MLLKWISRGARVSLMAGALLLALDASADPAWRDGMLLAGHDPIVDPVLRRYPGKVTGLGSPGKTGRVYTLRLQPLGPKAAPPAPNALRGWRLTVLKGARFGQVYWVQSNTADAITVRSKDGSLDGMAAGDLFVVEELDPDPPATSLGDDGGKPRVA